MATRRESYDYATSRAVARLNILLELTAPYVKVGGAVLAMKGAAAREELEEAKSAIKKLGLKIEEVKDFSVDGATHSVIVLRKIAPTPAQYPRRYAKIKQKAHKRTVGYSKSQHGNLTYLYFVKDFGVSHKKLLS